MPTPVGPAPRDPNDPDFWDWGDGYQANGGHDDADLASDLARRRRRRSVAALAIVVLLVAFVIAASL
ncbi:MAG: hypothetical protein ACYDD6_02220 [Acidimicrobiales bacterium]